jgi:hypothetical protein
MDVNLNTLETRIREMYPEISKNNIGTKIRYDQDTGTWVIRFKTGEHSLETHLEKKDVEDCMSGTQCVHLGVQIGRFVEYYCLRDNVCPTGPKK